MDKPLEHPISVSSARVRPLFDQARDAGLDVEDLLTSLELPLALLERNNGESVSLADYYRIQNRLAILFGDETLHLSSRQLLPGSTDFVLQHVGDCKNLYEVMGIVAKTYNLLHGGQYNAVARRRSSIDYVIDDRQFPYIANQSLEYIYFSTECILIFFHCILMSVSAEAKTAIVELHLRRPSPGGDCDHLGYWDAPIKFGAETYRVSFKRETAMNPITMPAPEALTSNAVYQKIIEVVDGQRAKFKNARSIAALVRDALSRGVVEQPDVAAQMGMSVATLRRRLDQEGSSFRVLRRDALNATAKRLLLDNQSVANVADALGFSEFRAFNRAFKEWNGVTPKAFVRDTKRSRS